jgi:hypothetical protein
MNGKHYCSWACREIKSAYRPELKTGTPQNDPEATTIEPTCSAVRRSIVHLWRILLLFCVGNSLWVMRRELAWIWSPRLRLAKQMKTEDQLFVFPAIQTDMKHKSSTNTWTWYCKWTHWSVFPISSPFTVRSAVCCYGLVKLLVTTRMNTKYMDFNPLNGEPVLKNVQTRSFCLAENTKNM